LPVCFIAFRQAFWRYLNCQFTDKEISAHFGPSEEGVIKKLVESEWQACLELYLKEYNKAHSICDKPFPGIEIALNLCKQKNIALSIVTGKGKSSAAISLQYLGLESYFDVIETGSPKGSIKPKAIKSVLHKWDLSPESVAYIGDSASDIVDAKEVGVIPLAAAWAKSASFERLEAMSPIAIFSTVEDLIFWIHNHS
jgi:phosphoglycolate phosphatase-like HAD superfamily hydrolase